MVDEFPSAFKDAVLLIRSLVASGVESSGVLQACKLFLQDMRMPQRRISPSTKLVVDRDDFVPRRMESVEQPSTQQFPVFCPASLSPAGQRDFAVTKPRSESQQPVSALEPNGQPASLAVSLTKTIPQSSSPSIPKPTSTEKRKRVESTQKEVDVIDLCDSDESISARSKLRRLESEMTRLQRVIKAKEGQSEPSSPASDSGISRFKKQMSDLTSELLELSQLQTKRRLRLKEIEEERVELEQEISAEDERIQRTRARLSELKKALMDEKERESRAQSIDTLDDVVIAEQPHCRLWQNFTELLHEAKREIEEAKGSDDAQMESSRELITPPLVTGTDHITATYVSPLVAFRSYRLLNDKGTEFSPLCFRHNLESVSSDVLCVFETQGGVCQDMNCGSLHFSQLLGSLDSMKHETAEDSVICHLRYFLSILYGPWSVCTNNKPKTLEIIDRWINDVNEIRGCEPLKWANFVKRMVRDVFHDIGNDAFFISGNCSP